VIVIDGGMWSELARRGVQMHPHAWAATAVLDNANELRATHEDYIRAGAEVVIANTFAASHQALKVSGLSDRAGEINRRSVEVACEARDNVADGDVLVAGAIWPGWIGGQASDFPKPSDGFDYLTSCVREQATWFAEGGADLIAFEMIPSAFWGHLAVDAVADLGLPVWLGTSYMHDVLATQTTLYPFEPAGQVGELVSRIIEGTRADVMVVAVTAHAETWVGRGVQIVGGCCGIGPEHIRAVKDRLPTRVPDETRRPRPGDSAANPPAAGGLGPLDAK
jgi:homocysteine S-methyltransferase